MPQAATSHFIAKSWRRASLPQSRNTDPQIFVQNFAALITDIHTFDLISFATS